MGSTMASFGTFLKEMYPVDGVAAALYGYADWVPAAQVTPALMVSTTVVAAVVAVGWIVDRRNRLAAERAAGVEDNYTPWFLTMANQVVAALVEWIRGDARNLLPMKAGA